MSQQSRQYYLGVNCAYHESSVCIMVDGKVIVALEEERFNRQRHGKSAQIAKANVFPLAALERCLLIAGIGIEDIGGIGCSFMPDARYQLNRGLSLPEASAQGWATETGEREFRDRLMGVPAELSDYFNVDLTERWHWFSHHLCHVAGAYAQSGFSEAALLCVDGIGEFNSVSMGYAKAGQLDEIDSVAYPHSLGLLWEKMALFLGFTEYDATKVMSLAAFGNADIYREAMALLLQNREQKDGELFIVDDSIAGLRSDGFDGLSAHFGVQPLKAGEPRSQAHLDLVAALQQQTEQVLVSLVGHLAGTTDSKNLCYSGGVALNCLANQQICRSGHFEQYFIQPAANDAGTAIGAAYLLTRAHIDVTAKPVVYLGTEYASSDIRQLLQQSGFDYCEPDDLSGQVAKLLSEGKIVGWFQGRMEFGPRSLGNRSILADPRNPQVKERIDNQIKFRDKFRPYAPSILQQQAKDWFDIAPGASLASQYMLVAAQVLPQQAQRIDAVVHRDGSSRIHLVSADANPQYYQLIDRFYRLTGVPMLLNTSFNSQSPIVETPAQALETFKNTAIDVLVIGQSMIQKPEVNRTDQQFMECFCVDSVFRTTVIEQFKKQTAALSGWSPAIQYFIGEYQRRVGLLQQGKTALSYSALQYQISRW